MSLRAGPPRVRPHRVRPIRARPNRARPNRARPNRADHCHSGQDPTGSGHTGPIIATQGRTTQGQAKQGRSMPLRAGPQPHRVRPHRVRNLFFIFRSFIQFLLRVLHFKIILKKNCIPYILPKTNSSTNGSSSHSFASGHLPVLGLHHTTHKSEHHFLKPSSFARVISPKSLILFTLLKCFFPFILSPFKLTSKARVTSPKSSTILDFSTHFVFNLKKKKICM